MQPVRRQCVFRAPEHGAHIHSVVLARIEIGVFRDRKWHVHLGIGLRDQIGLQRALGVRSRIGAQQILQRIAEGGPDLGPHVHEFVPHRQVEHGNFVDLDHAGVFQRRHVQDHVTDRHATVAVDFSG